MSKEWLDELNIPVVKDRHYWFVRTTGGVHYEDFIMHDYIAIGWNYISISALLNKSEDTVKRLIETNEAARVESTLDPEELVESGVDDNREKGKSSVKKAVSLIYNKINRFVNEFREGDIVLIPSRNSDVISIGVLVGPVYEDTLYVQKYYQDNPMTDLCLCPFYKRRKVQWLKHIIKTDLDVFLARAISAQHSVSCVDEFANLINRSVYDIYATDNHLHTTIHAGHPDGLSFAELKTFVNGMDDGMAMIASAMGINYKPEEMDVKIMIHSPGLMEICALVAGSGIIVCALIFAINQYRHGGKTKLNFKIKFAGQELEFHAEHESEGTLSYQQEIKKLDIKKIEKLIEIQDKLGIEYPEVEIADNMSLASASEISTKNNIF